MAWIDNRILQYNDHYCLHVFKHDENDKLSIMTASLAEVIHLERMGRRKEVKAAIEEERRAVDAKLAELEQRLKSLPGKLPVVKAWQPESVVYKAEMVSHNGSLYQARRDTAQSPGGSDWICVARHGRDAITPSIRGDYDAHERYAELDVVSYDGASYIAQHDDPAFPATTRDGKCSAQSAWTAARRSRRPSRTSGSRSMRSSRHWSRRRMSGGP
jgi:hypothetical protein